VLAVTRELLPPWRPRARVGVRPVSAAVRAAANGGGAYTR